MVDHAGNVHGWLGKNGEKSAPVVLAAHLDTVFGAEVDVAVERRGQRLEGPGISDNARGLAALRSEEHTSELQSRVDLVCRLLLEKKNQRYRAGRTKRSRVPEPGLCRRSRTASPPRAARRRPCRSRDTGNHPLRGRG